MSPACTRRHFLASTPLLPAACAAATAALADRPPPAYPLGGSWKFVPAFSDEFDGVGLDDTKWWDFNPARAGFLPPRSSPEQACLQGARGTPGGFTARDLACGLTRRSVTIDCHA
jgi:hypothetical protein